MNPNTILLSLHEITESWLTYCTEVQQKVFEVVTAAAEIMYVFILLGACPA